MVLQTDSSLFLPDLSDKQARLTDVSIVKLEESSGIDDADAKPLYHHVLFLSAVCSGQMMVQAQLGSAIVAGSSIGTWLGTTDRREWSWMPAAYGMTLGVFVLLTGRLGDIYGSKNVFVGGFTFMSIANLASGFCKSPIAFDVCRALAGIGGAAVLPNGAGLIGRAYPPGSMLRTVGFSVFGALAPAGNVIGGAMGALLAQTIGSRWIYFITAIVALLFAVFGFLILPRDRIFLSEKVDLLGFALGATSLCLIDFAFNQGPLVGWNTPYVYSLLLVGLLLIVAFVNWEKHAGKAALLPPAIFSRDTTVVLIPLWFGWMSFGCFIYYTASFLRDIRGLHNPLYIIAEISPFAPGGVFAALLVTVLFSRLEGHWIMAMSMMSFCVGNLLMSLTPVHQTYWAMVFPAVLLVCFGPDLSFASSSLIISNAVEQDLQGTAGGLVTTIVNYSLSIGLGMAGTVERYVGGNGENVLEGYRGAFYFATCISFVGFLIVVLFVRTKSIVPS